MSTTNKKVIHPNMPVNDLYLEKIGFAFIPHVQDEYLKHVGQLYFNFEETAIYCVDSNFYLIVHQGKKVWFGKIPNQKYMTAILENAGAPVKNFSIEDLALID